MKRILLTGCCLLAAFPALAEEADENPEIVVTAARLPALEAEVPGARVIGREEIETRGAVFAADVLETVPGLSLSRNGAFGGITSARLRGAASDKTLVLVDGVPVNDPSQPSGGADLASLELADVERIEVLSGPQGSLWGSDAIGGVIAVVTREADGLSAELEAGSLDTARGALSVGRREDGWALGASLSGFRTDGVSKAAAGSERDGFESRTAGLNGRMRLSDRLTLDGRVRWNESETGVDGFPAPLFVLADTDEVYRTETWSGFARLRASDLLGLDHALSVGLYDYDRAQTGGDFPYRYTADRRVWRWTAERDRAGEAVSLALGAEREEVRADLSTGEGDQGATAAFVVARTRIGERLSMTGSLRRDDPDGYEGQTTGRAAAVAELGAGVRLSAAWGQGFKTPTVSQTLCDFCFPAGPALDLKPERAEGWDLGLDWRSRDGRVEASLLGWRLEVEDQIDFVFDFATFTSRYRNIDRTRTRGLEAEASAELAPGLRVRAAWAWTDARDLTTGERLLRVPARSGSAALDWRGERARASLIVRAEGKQADVDGFSPATREGFVVADLAAGLRLTRQAEATLRIENLGDATYQEALGYGEPGRAAYVGLRLRY
ncbi:MAG TPA: TonB-dependent receptor [Caulobacteraceae bacterium]|nr:TonB-dependent receptor [Caulobacteraceae bacterium]